MTWEDISLIKQLNFGSTYTNAVESDIGKTVQNVGATVTGVLLGYINTSGSDRQWIVKQLTGSFTVNMDLTIDGGTGTGRISSLPRVVTGEARIVLFQIFDEGITTIRLEGTPRDLNPSNVSLAELARHSLNAAYIGIGANGDPDLGCARPTNGLMYPRKI